MPFSRKDYSAPSVFKPDALLQSARQQKRLDNVAVPEICILDPDGDIVRWLRQTGQARPFDAWPCYHTQLDTFPLAGETAGIIGCAVGAPFAVLVAEELFASGCRLLFSITSAGQITPAGPVPYFVIIDRALRDEGTSCHYAPPAEYADAPGHLVKLATEAIKARGMQAVTGLAWTTDAPFRETAEAIDHARSKGALAVEMEAAALYTLANAKSLQILCLAHVTNTMGQAAQEFEKGEAQGAAEAIRLLDAIIGQCANNRQ